MARLLVPEVLQGSAMDCGPAVLKALLEGLGIEASYQRIRDACRTGADGTSIDALEDLAVGLGLEAYQEMVPVDDALGALARQTPCVAIVRSTSDAPHFVVVWRIRFGFAQIMDPARGRLLIPAKDLQRDLHVHEQPFAREDFRRWWDTTEWFRIVEQRLTRLSKQGALDSDTDPCRLGLVEASARLVERLAVRGSDAAEIVDAFACASASGEGVIPETQLAIRSRSAEEVVVRGAVFLVVRNPGRRGGVTPDAAYARVLGGDGPSAGRLLSSQLSERSRILLLSLSLLSVLTAVVSVGEMVFLRAAFNAHTLLALPQQRIAGTLLYALLVGLLLALDAATSFGIVRLGRAVELRLRMALLAKLPRLPDHFFRSRSMSDVTHRSQGLFHVKALPDVVFAIVKHGIDVLVTAVALCVIYPPGAPFAAAAVLFGVVLPALSLRARQRVEGRVQTHASSLGQLYLDSLLGLVPLRTHGGQLSIRAKQDEYLAPWRRESERSVSLLAATEAVQGIGTLLLVAILILRFVQEAPNQATLLLVAFWALRLPLQTRAFSASLQHLPGIRASLTRLVEPLTADETPAHAEPGPEPVLRESHGLAIRVDDLSVVLGSQLVLDGVSLKIQPGERIAIVGSSGAGKSTLIACLLGLVDRASGLIAVDDVPLEQFDIGRLRRQTVWVDPAVQLWNRPAIENLQFGNPRGARHPLHPAIEHVGLEDLLERLPKGLATELGESGARVSGGEGQRIRTARALLRRGVRLVLLDEAFRGLERPVRQRASQALRARVAGATILEVTHDVADTQGHDRVLVIEDGKLIEEGTPARLLGRRSRYAELVDADREVHARIWSAEHWKRVSVGDGLVVTEEAPS
jgi:ABC-type bacteriocin/lantibiotic exporter with double-glycine peptidase domain